MTKVDKTIKKYEPMMYSLLRRFKIKKDYEDILQLLRIKTWEVLRDKKYKKIYKNKKGEVVEAKFMTWLYKVLLDRLQDILKVDYGIKIKDDKKPIEDLSIEKQNFYHIKHPIFCGVCFFPIENYDTENELKCKLDFELYYKQLSKEDKLLLDLMKTANGNKKEVATKLKCTVRNLNRRLSKLRGNYKNYLIKGEHNG